MRNLLTVVSILALMGLATAAMALSSQDTHDVELNVDEIAELEVTPGANVVMTLVTPGTGGAAIAPVTDETTYLQYTSVVLTGEDRDITAEVTSATTSAGTRLDVEVIAITSGVGVGDTGAATGEQELSVEGMPAGDKVVVDQIGSCATGVGATDGAQVRYTFGVETVGNLVADDDQVVTVTYTLTDGS